MKRITSIILSVLVVSALAFVGCKKDETKTNVAFNNKIYTVISVTCNGETKNVPVGGSVTFYDVKGSTVSYTGSSKGTTTSGAQVGLSMSWSSSITLSGGATSLDLITSKDYFYLKVKNSGWSTLYDLYVNYGLSSQSYDNVTFPYSSTLPNPVYETGYYNAWTNSNVRLTYTDGASQVWNMTANQGTNFTIPFTENQSVEVNFNPSYKSMNFTATSIPLTKGAIPQYATVN